MLFICVTAIALLFAICTNEYRVRKQALSVIARHGGIVEFNDGQNSSFLSKDYSDTVRRIEIRVTALDDELLWAIGQLTEVSEISIVNSRVGKHECRSLSQLPSLTSVSLFGTHIDDGAVLEIARCQKLSSVDLSFSNATDIDCKHLTECKSLRRIALNGTQVTDKGLEAIASLRCISVVFISEGPITEHGIETLLSKRELSALYCFGDRFEDNWWTSIRTRYPKCRVYR
jgi:hypothetical protein